MTDIEEYKLQKYKIQKFYKLRKKYMIKEIEVTSINYWLT